MSSTINQRQSFWKTVEAQLRSILVEPSTDSITVLTAEDAASWSRTLIISCLILQDLLPDGLRQRSDGSLKQWCFSIAKTDILIVARVLKEYQLFIRNYPDEWEFLNYNAFKQRFPSEITGAFWSPVLDVLMSYLANPTPATFSVINQWVSFPLKLTLKGLAKNLEQDSVLEFLFNEERLATLDLPPSDCESIARVLEEWFGDLYYQSFLPHHSNGAVANADTKRGLYGKYRKMTSDYRVSYLYRKFGINELDYGFAQATEPGTHANACARFITVPKGIDKRRTICPEPVEYQFNQQGVWRMLDEYIINHPNLSRHISIHDQTVNQSAALEASRYCDAATIDLSSASDSVSWSLVKRIFYRVPRLYGMLWATRSTSVLLPGGQKVATSKYAPMGSALCFPVESIIFAAICQVAENNTGHVRTRDTYHVYGDDIIVPDSLYSETCRLLKATGFLVNEHKTFYPYSRFKESCGLEGLDGIDVTPIGISRKFSADSFDVNRPELVSCYITFANTLSRMGYMRARAYVLAKVLEIPSYLAPPFTENANLGIWSPSPSNWTAEKRYHLDWQCDVIKVGCIAVTLDPDPFDADQILFDRTFGVMYHEIRYLETLRRLSETKRQSLIDPDDLIKVTLCKARPRTVSRWLPEWWFTSTTSIKTVDFDGEHLLLGAIVEPIR